MRSEWLAGLMLLASCSPAPTGQRQASIAQTRVEAQISELPAPYGRASYENGRRAFSQCRRCHTLNADAPNLVGPNLHGVFGRQVASIEGYTYSRALLDARFQWDAATLDQWLANPHAFLPGNRMGLAGVDDPEERRDLIAFLMLETAE
jgi:cytochrome c